MRPRVATVYLETLRDQAANPGVTDDGLDLAPAGEALGWLTNS